VPNRRSTRARSNVGPVCGMPRQPNLAGKNVTWLLNRGFRLPFTVHWNFPTSYVLLVSCLCCAHSGPTFYSSSPMMTRSYCFDIYKESLPPLYSPEQGVFILPSGWGCALRKQMSMVRGEKVQRRTAGFAATLSLTASHHSVISKPQLYAPLRCAQIELQTAT
jgi:hypothetical protein